MSTFTVRDLQYEKDLPRIVELAHIVYGYDKTSYANHLEWKYVKNPSGRAILAICEKDGELLGCVGIFPVFMKIGDKVVRCAWGGDAMVHPAFRRSKIFVEMFQHLFENQASSNNISLVFATRFRNSPTVRGVLKYIRFRPIGRLTVFKKYISPISAVAHLWPYEGLSLGSITSYFSSLAELIVSTCVGNLISLFGSHRGYDESQYEINEMIPPFLFGHDFEELWQEVQGSLRLAVVKNQSYLNWRFSNPGYIGWKFTDLRYLGFKADEDGHIRGYCIMAYTNLGKLRIARVLDLLAANERVVDRLVRHAVERAKEDKIDLFLMLANNQTSHVTRALGITRAWRKDVLVARIVDSTVPEQVVGNISNWYLNFADSEDWL